MAQDESRIKLKNVTLISEVGAGTGANKDHVLVNRATVEQFSIDKLGLPIMANAGDKFRVVSINVGDIVADSDAIEFFLLKPSGTINVVYIGLSVDTDIGDDNVNFQTIVVENDSNAAVATLTTDIAWTAGAIQTMGSITNPSITSAEYLTVKFTKDASGLAMSGLTFNIAYTVTL